MLIQDLSRKEGITVLLSSHHLHQVQQICDRVGLFVKGRLIACGDIESLSRQLDGGASFTVELDLGEWNDKLIERLSAVEGVQSVERVEADALEGSSYVTARVACSRYLAPQLAKIVLEHNVDLHGMRPLRYGLDDIYHRYFEGGEAS
jgi:ABC-2 type transport system ATP-binding protein